MKCPHPAGRRWSSGWEKLSLDQEDLALGRCERRSLAGLEAARSQGQLSGPSWGGLGRIERENAVRAGQALAENGFCSVCIFLTVRASWHLLQTFTFREFLSCCSTSEPLGAARPRAVGEGAQAPASAPQAPAAAGARKGPVSPRVRGAGPAVLWLGLSVSGPT